MGCRVVGGKALFSNTLLDDYKYHEI